MAPGSFLTRAVSRARGPTLPAKPLTRLDTAAPTRTAADRVEAAALLLRTGRPAMALRLLEGLGEAVREERQAAYAAGRDAGMRARAKPPRPDTPAGGNPRPAFKRQSAEPLAAADVLGVQRVAAILGVAVADLPPLFAGTV